MTDDRKRVGSNGFREWTGVRRATARLSHIGGSLAALAEKAHLSAGTLYAIKAGKRRNMYVSTAAKLAGALGGECRINFGSGPLAVPKRKPKANERK